MFEIEMTNVNHVYVLWNFSGCKKYDAGKSWLKGIKI